MRRGGPKPSEEIGINKDHSNEQVISDIQKGVSTHSSLRNVCANLAFIPKLPKSFNETEKDEYWIGEM